MSSEAERSVLYEHQLKRLNHARRWLAAKLPGAECRAGDEEGFPTLYWKGWEISLDPVVCLDTGGVPLPAVLRRGEIAIPKVCRNLPHLLNSVTKIVRENP